MKQTNYNSEWKLIHTPYQNENFDPNNLIHTNMQEPFSSHHWSLDTQLLGDIEHPLFDNAVEGAIYSSLIPHPQSLFLLVKGQQQHFCDTNDYCLNGFYMRFENDYITTSGSPEKVSNYGDPDYESFSRYYTYYRRQDQQVIQ